MAQRVSDNPETDLHYATQAALGASLALQVRNLSHFLNPARLRETFPQIRTGAAALGVQYAAAASSLAADYYDERRDAAGVDSPFAVPMIDPKTLEQFESYIDKAADELLASIDAAVDEIYLAEITAQIQREVESAAQKVAVDAGREQIFEAIRSDREARGWARVTRPNACSFCRFLAARGAVYDKESVAFRAHVAVNGRGGTCQCSAEPQFAGAYEPPAHTRADAALYDRVAEDGFRGAEALNEFRRRAEGRADGPRRSRPGGATAPTPTEVRGQQLGFLNLTVTQLENQLNVLEQLPDSEYRTKQIARVRHRLTELARNTPR